MSSVLPKLFDKKKDNFEKKVIPKTSGKHISVLYGCIRFIDCYRVLRSSLALKTISYTEIQQKSLEKFDERYPDNGIITNKTEEYKFQR